MNMRDMVRETISEFCFEKDIDIEGDEVEELLDAIEACFEYASYSVATPSVNMEIKKLGRELEIERSKVPCPACKGSGVEVSYGPAHKGRGRWICTIPMWPCEQEMASQSFLCHKRKGEDNREQFIYFSEGEKEGVDRLFTMMLALRQQILLRRKFENETRNNV